jgi:hypothetical protein
MRLIVIRKWERKGEPHGERVGVLAAGLLAVGWKG